MGDHAVVLLNNDILGQTTADPNLGREIEQAVMRAVSDGSAEASAGVKVVDYLHSGEFALVLFGGGTAWPVRHEKLPLLGSSRRQTLIEEMRILARHFGLSIMEETEP